MSARKKEMLAEEETPPENIPNPSNPSDILQNAIREGEDQGKKIKRHRRSREEIEAQRRQAEQKQLDDTNFEIFAQLIKMMSDKDADKYGFQKTPVSEFHPIAKQYSIICNYYMPSGKPIYFVIASATLQTFLMLQNRNAKINEVLKGQPKENSDNADPQNVNFGEVRFGQEFPSQTPVKNL